MIVAAGMVISLAVVVYLVGMLVWNERSYQLYMERVSKPWHESIEKCDWASCSYWRELGTNFPLRTPETMANPLAWVRYWNWRPIGPVPDLPEFRNTGHVQ